VEIVVPAICLVASSFRNAGMEHFGNSTLTSLPHPPCSACRARRQDFAVAGVGDNAVAEIGAARETGRLRWPSFI